jgi:hypothetical protein
MATDLQIVANRRNAKRSTGPRTPKGKAASSGNALKSGIYAKAIIIQGEDPAEFQALQKGYYRDYQPATTDERILLDDVVQLAWRKKRLDNTYNQMWMREMEHNRKSPYQKDATCNVRPFNGNDNQFAKLRREYTAYDRAFHRARTELVKIQKDRTRAELASFPQKTTQPPAHEPAVPAPSHTEIGFVPANNPQDRHAPAPDPRTLPPAPQLQSPLTLPRNNDKLFPSLRGATSCTLSPLSAHHGHQVDA